jgi:hypothetical protein
MDSDILFMKNVAELFHNVLNSITFIPNRKKEEFELTVLGLGAIHLWSPVGLHKYSSYMIGIMIVKLMLKKTSRNMLVS